MKSLKSIPWLLSSSVLSISTWVYVPQFFGDRNELNETASNVYPCTDLLTDLWAPQCWDSLASDESSLRLQIQELGFRWPAKFSNSVFLRAILEGERRYGIEREILLSVALIESGLDSKSVSEKGAQGIFQFRPATAEGIWKDFLKSLPDDDALHQMQPDKAVWDLRASALLGAFYLSKLRSNFHNHMHLALAAYNIGPGALRKALTEGDLKGSEYIFRVYHLRNGLKALSSG